jgi:hypothetical protein
MNQRIAKKIEQVYHDSSDWYEAYSVPQRCKAYWLDLRRLKRKAAAVRAKRGWAPRQVALTVPLSRTSVAFGALRPDASWLPNPYCA